MNKNKITYIFAAYKFSESVKETLDYLIYVKKKFDHHDVEIIIICVEDLIKFEINYSKFCKIVSDSGNISTAWNIGLSFAKKSLICFLGDGDFPSLKLINFILNAKNITSDSIINSKAFFYVAGSLYKRLKPADKIKVTTFGVNAQTPALYIQSDLISGFKFNNKYRIGMDVELILFIISKKHNIITCQHPTLIEMDGISVKSRNDGILEYINILVNEKKIGNKKAAAIIIIYPFYKVVKEFLYIQIRNILRQFKHIYVFILNLFLNLLPGGWPRKFILSSFGIKIGKGSSLRSIFRLYGLRNIRIGNNSVVNRGCILDNRGLIDIGNNVSIAHDVRIYTAGHNINSPYFYQYISQVEIQDFVSIFPNSIINPGVILKKGCIVLGGSSVYGVFDENSIIAGNPATKIGDRHPLFKYNSSYDFRFAQ
jgi:acetyltransferase-like isoleucine patch superfamily enzyme